ncbi:copper chaperone [Roseibium marinum]|uniref:Putative metal-binding membrane protein n=1 Tax=Roseibium marinum TaxID=281252 RepID=A0A2S3UTZ4_9HYPH|nr:DUF2182 domain-containing protein [Roseibium marinum]POF31040.1 putative metal-binding membrane protein [Roseibium marinum]
MSRLAAFAFQLKLSPMPQLLGLSAAAFMVLGLQPASVRISSICGGVSLDYLADILILEALVRSPSALVLDWLIMVLAMMPPLLSLPVSHILRAPAKGYRIGAACLFALGYGLCWLLAGAVLVPLAFVVAAAAPFPLDTVASFAFALVWSASPSAQSARNRCHRLRRISASGLRTLRDCADQGAMTGTACVAACWPWMIVPMTVENLHLTAMAAVTIVLFAERLAPPAKPQWRSPPVWETLAGFSPV